MPSSGSRPAASSHWPCHGAASRKAHSYQSSSKVCATDPLIHLATCSATPTSSTQHTLCDVNSVTPHPALCTGAIAEKKQPRFSSTVSMPALCESLRKAAYDPRVAGLYMNIDILGAGWAKVEEIRAHIEFFKASGKPTVAYMKRGGEKEYFLATACDEIYIPPVAQLSLRGLSVQGQFLRGVLDKAGVEPQVPAATPTATHSTACECSCATPSGQDTAADARPVWPCPPVTSGSALVHVKRVLSLRRRGRHSQLSTTCLCANCMCPCQADTLAMLALFCSAFFA